MRRDYSSPKKLIKLDLGLCLTLTVALFFAKIFDLAGPGASGEIIPWWLVLVPMAVWTTGLLLVLIFMLVVALITGGFRK